jgi:hypothetical protein
LFPLRKQTINNEIMHGGKGKVEEEEEEEGAKVGKQNEGVTTHSIHVY